MYKGKKKIFDKIQLYCKLDLSGFDPGTFRFVHCTLAARPAVPGHRTSVGGINNDVSWSFVGKSMSAAITCENKSMSHRHSIYSFI